MDGLLFNLNKILFGHSDLQGWRMNFSRPVKVSIFLSTAIIGIFFTCVPKLYQVLKRYWFSLINC